MQMNLKSPIDRVWIAEFFGTTDPTTITIISMIIIFVGIVGSLALFFALFKLPSVKVVLVILAVMFFAGYVSLAWNGSGFDYFPLS